MHIDDGGGEPGRWERAPRVMGRDLHHREIYARRGKTASDSLRAQLGGETLRERGLKTQRICQEGFRGGAPGEIRVGGREEGEE